MSETDIGDDGKGTHRQLIKGDFMMIELLLACVCACLAGISYRIWELSKTLKEIFVKDKSNET